MDPTSNDCDRSVKHCTTCRRVVGRAAQLPGAWHAPLAARQRRQARAACRVCGCPDSPPSPAPRAPQVSIFPRDHHQGGRRPQRPVAGQGAHQPARLPTTDLARPSPRADGLFPCPLSSRPLQAICTKCETGYVPRASGRGCYCAPGYFTNETTSAPSATGFTCRPCGAWGTLDRFPAPRRSDNCPAPEPHRCPLARQHTGEPARDRCAAPANFPHLAAAAKGRPGLGWSG